MTSKMTALPRLIKRNWPRNSSVIRFGASGVIPLDAAEKNAVGMSKLRTLIAIRSRIPGQTCRGVPNHEERVIQLRRVRVQVLLPNS